MKIHTDFKVSKPTKRNWSGVFGYRPEKSSIARVYGEMFAVMSISSDIDFELSHIGDMLFDEMQASYFEEYKTQLSFEDFEQAMAKVHERITAVLDREPELAQTGLDLEMAVLIIKEDALYGGVVGESKIFISRGDNFAEIGKSFIDTNNDGFMRSGSIGIEADDKLLLSTSKPAESKEPAIAEMLANFKLDLGKAGSGAMLSVGYELAVEPVATKPESEVDAAEPAIQAEDEELEDEVPSKVGEPDQEVLPMADPEFGEEAEDMLETGMEPQDQLSADDVEDELSAQPSRVDALKAKAGVALSGLQNRLLLAKNAAAKKAADIRSRSALGKVNDELPMEEDQETPAMIKEFDQDVRADEHGAGGRLSGAKSSAQRLLKRAATKANDGVALVRSRVMPAPGDRTMYLRKGHSQTKWKTIILIGVVILVILVLIINKRNEEVAVERHIQEVETKISELENTWQQLKTEASAASIGEVPAENKQDIAARIAEVVKSAESLLGENIGTDRLDEIISETQKSQDALFNVRSFTDPQVVADLELTFEGADAAAAVYASGNIFVADRARGVVYRMGTTLNSEVSSFATGLSSPYLLTADPNGNVVFVDNNSDSVMGTIDATSGNVSRSPSDSLARIGTLAGMDIYDANAALYSVNPAKNMVVKQENISGNYVVPNDAAPWRQDADFANAVALKVDYSIFMLVKGKGLLRYEGGEPATYNASGFSAADTQALQNASAFDLTATKLYIADPAGRRLIVAERTNADTYTFKEQYVYRGDDDTVFSKMQSVSVNEANGKIYVLDGNRVIRLDI